MNNLKIWWSVSKSDIYAGIGILLGILAFFGSFIGLTVALFWEYL